MTSLMDKIQSKETFRLLTIGIRAGRFKRYPSPVSFSSFFIFYYSKNHVQTSLTNESKAPSPLPLKQANHLAHIPLVFAPPIPTLILPQQLGNHHIRHKMSLVSQILGSFAYFVPTRSGHCQEKLSLVPEAAQTAVPLMPDAG